MLIPKLKVVVLLLCTKVLPNMAHFGPRDVTAVAASAAVWAILNILLSPIVWELTHMPLLCDLLAFASLILVVWWIRKLGAASLTGLIVAVLTFILRPGSFYILGFVAGAVAFDLLSKGVGYTRLFRRPFSGSLIMILLSVVCAALAGALIASFFMGLTTLIAVATFSGLHAIGGFMGGALGVVTVRALEARGVAEIDAALRCHGAS